MVAWRRGNDGDAEKSSAKNMSRNIFRDFCRAGARPRSKPPRAKQLFNRLASGRGLCCSLTDGVTVADPDWESREGHYRVRLYGEWIDVPDDALITEPNRAGQTMVWPMLFNGEISVRCFMPGSMT